jgi:hypothetical protein
LSISQRAILIIYVDLHCPTITEEIRRFSSHYGAHLRTHPNRLAANLLGVPVNRRLRGICLTDSNVLFLILQRFRTRASKRLLNTATQDLKQLIRQIKNDRVQSYLQDLQPTAAADYSLWKATKSLKRIT